MSRLRSEAVTVRATNNVWTALTGTACAAVLVALILVAMKWYEITESQPLFFGLF